MKKKFLSMAIVALLASAALTGCGNKQEETKTDESVGTVITDANDNAASVQQDTDDDNDQNTQNMISVDDVAKGKSMLTNESDGVSLTKNNGEYIENTYYYYKDGTLQSIEIAHMYKDKEAAQKAYDAMSKDDNTKKEYPSIDIEDNTVYMLAAQEKVDSLKSLNQQQLYDKLKSENPDAMTEENSNQQQNSGTEEKKEENK